MLSFAQVATLKVCVGSWLAGTLARLVRRPGCRGSGSGRRETRQELPVDHPFATRRAKHCKVMVGGERSLQLAVAAGTNPLPRSKARPCSNTVLYDATPRRPLVKVELVHEAVSISKPRWLASLVRWTESRTSLGSVLKFAGWLDGYRCRGVEKGEII